MRRYTVTINGTDHVIDVEEVTADTFTVHLGGRLLDVRLTDHQDLAQAMITPHVEAGAGRATPVPAIAETSVGPTMAETGAGASASGTKAGTAAAGVSEAPSAEPGRPPARPPRTPVAGGDQARLTAPMPGLVLSVPVAVGEAVSRGQTLLVLEAMKMKNDLRAGRDGVVKAILVAPGDQVRYGEPLVEFEAS